jgi:hypothetical protein
MQLAVIEDFAEVFKAIQSPNLTSEARIASDLVEIVWMSLFELYPGSEIAINRKPSA